MSNQSAEFHATADLALFGIRPGYHRDPNPLNRLAVLLVQDRDGVFSLPRLTVDGPIEASVDRFVKETLQPPSDDAALAPFVWLANRDRPPTIERTRSGKLIMDLGLAAVATLVEPPVDSRVIFASPHQIIANRAPALKEADRQLIALGLASLNRKTDVRKVASTEAMEDRLPIFARLVTEPRLAGVPESMPGKPRLSWQRLSIAALRRVFEAMVGQSLDPRNFSSDAKANLGLVATGEKLPPEEGRPADGFRIPRSKVNPPA